MAGYWLRYEGTRFPVRRGEMLIGRSAYCSIVISDPSVSREHAALRLGGDGLQIVDLGSRNGTFVNGSRVEETRNLTQGDTIVLGRALMQVLSGEAAPRAPRAKMHTMPFSADQEPPDVEDPTTQTHPLTLTLIETLVQQAMAESEASAAVAAAIRGAIDALLLESGRPGTPFDRTGAERPAAAATTVAGWMEDGSLDDWRDGVTRRLEARDG